MKKELLKPWFLSLILSDYTTEKIIEEITQNCTAKNLDELIHPLFRSWLDKQYDFGLNREETVPKYKDICQRIRQQKLDKLPKDEIKINKDFFNLDEE